MMLLLTLLVFSHGAQYINDYEVSNWTCDFRQWNDGLCWCECGYAIAPQGNAMRDPDCYYEAPSDCKTGWTCDTQKNKCVDPNALSKQASECGKCMLEYDNCKDMCVECLITDSCTGEITDPYLSAALSMGGETGCENMCDMAASYAETMYEEYTGKKIDFSSAAGTGGSDYDNEEIAWGSSAARIATLASIVLAFLRV